MNPTPKDEYGFAKIREVALFVVQQSYIIILGLVVLIKD